MSGVCNNTALYQSLRFCQGKTILPGIRNRAYAIPKRDIVTWPTLPAEATTNISEIATYQGSFVLETGKKWLRIDLVTDKGNITYETQGEKPSRTFLNKCTLTHPEGSAAALGFARQAIADDLVYLIPQRNGTYRVLGCEAFETDTKPAGDTGEGVTGEVAASLEVEATDICPAPYYVGTIETGEADDGDIDLSSSTVSPAYHGTVVDDTQGETQQGNGN